MTDTITSDVSSASEKTPAQSSPINKAYIPPPPAPLQAGPEGILFDFNLGARIMLPPRFEGKWRITLRDFDTGNILFQNENTGATVQSAKRYYVKFHIEVDEIHDNGNVREVFRHTLDCQNQKVVIQFPVGTLGDTLAWFPYAAKFAHKHQAHVTCIMSNLIIPLFEKSYPELIFLSSEEAREQDIFSNSYAMYCMGLFFDDVACNQQPTDFRFVGLHKTAGYILGVNPEEEAPKLTLPDETRPIAEKYVCIAVQASTQCKYWNNPTGWMEVVAYLKEQGYRVICIDQKPVHGNGIVWNHIPYGAEDQTGNRPLTERARWLRHADFFIGLSSGLAWLAWAAGTPVVMISGFTHPTNEFHTPYRIINWHTCNSCWNDERERFDHHDFLWCPRHANTPRQFECTRLITSHQVIAKINEAIGRL
ncbi:autotransporter strand-loop-strand O-heptosyltransferase [Acetobacter sp. AAB5]|uniref:autotransporter strand-loop-strand O-heptosyltransferase n=1 Tax=Acetobacter sp. AAB5 TaxID=3418370 RepID=UPI003CF08741